MQNNPMTKEEFKTQKEAVLNGFQISSKPTIKSISALFFSGLISTFGIYSILLSMNIEGNNLYKAIGIFILILIVADTFKRGALANYLNSVTRNNILGNVKTRKMQLVISGLALSFMFVFDIVGSVSTANYTEQSYQDFRATNSKEFELLKDNAQNDKSALTIYSQELTTWTQEKADAKITCNEKWKGWKAKYKAKCKEEWNANNPKPTKPSSNGSVSVNDYRDVKSENNDDFLSSYMFYIILFLSLSLTMLLQYTTLSEILERHEDIDETLTPEVIGILQDRISELETNMIQHETKRNELISDSDREEKHHKRKFEKLGKAIKLLGINKAVEARGETVKRVANNSSFPTTTKKAGFVDFSFNQQDEVNEYRENQESVNNAVTAVNDENLIKALYSTVTDENSKLVSKPNVIDTTKRVQVQRLSKIYDVLKKSNVIELRGNKGYFALESLETALQAYREERGA